MKDKRGRAFARCDPGCGMILFAPERGGGSKAAAESCQEGEAGQESW